MNIEAWMDLRQGDDGEKVVCINEESTLRFKSHRVEVDQLKLGQEDDWIIVMSVLSLMFVMSFLKRYHAYNHCTQNKCGNCR